MALSARVEAAWRSLDRRAVDVVLALLLYAVLAAELIAKPAVSGEARSTPAAFLLGAAIVLPIVPHRRHPGWALLVAAVATLLYSAQHFIAFPGYAAFALVFVISLHSGRGIGALGYAVMTVVTGLSMAIQPAAVVTTSTLISCWLALTVAWLAGNNLRVRQQRWEEMRERADRLESEREDRARQAVTAERLRIARELHDVVAHSMSVIAVQAGVANHVIDSRPDQARAALRTVETNTRAALVEMRRLLGVLRREDEPSASLAPAPGLDDVPGLVEQFRAAGLAVDAGVDGTPRRPADGIDLSAFRIVQEGLTNVLRHGGPRARLRIGYQPDAIRIEIRDDGPAAPRSPGEPGHGLLGMRERVAVFGGTLAAGPRPGGGFKLVAVLPVAVSAVAESGART